MIKYEQLGGGGTKIVGDWHSEFPANSVFYPGSRLWPEYQEWLAEGNVPIPVRPSPYHNLNESDPANPVWGEDVGAREDAEARADLESLDRKVPRGVEDLIDTLESLLGLDIRGSLPAETRLVLTDKAARRAKVIP